MGYRSLSLWILVIAACNVTNKAPISVDAKFFEYELPNRTVTICPTHSLISVECPQIASPLAEGRTWPSNLPQYLISIDYIRSFPSRLGLEPGSCQADLSHACNSYDLRYINTLCNGRAQCPDIPTYQVRDRSLCAFKAVTEIGFHCVPTWHLREIQTKCDICKNGSLTNDYGFIYSRNYPLQTIRVSCFTTIYARPYHKIVLYFVSGELNHDQLRIESVSSEGLTILNISLNGNQSTQRLAVSTYEMKITFLPGPIHSPNPTYFLLYFYTIPFCSYTDPCPPVHPPPIHPPPPVYPPSLPPPTPLPTLTTPTVLPITTSRVRFQSSGWTRVPNIWIVVPILLGYIFLLLFAIVLALLFQRRRKQRKVLTNLATTNLPPRYIDTSMESSRAQLVTPLPVPLSGGGGMITRSSHRLTSASQTIHYPLPSPSFARNMERYHRESRSDFDLHHSAMSGVDYRPVPSLPYYSRSTFANGVNRAYGTMDCVSRSDMSDRRRSLPKSFSDCDICKRRVYAEEYQNYQEEESDNWRLENSMGRRAASPVDFSRPYRERVKERFRERLIVRKVPDSDPLVASSGTVEYSTVMPRNQRISSESNRSNIGPVHHLPFEYTPNDTTHQARSTEHKRYSSEERLSFANQQQQTTGDERGSANFTVKFYERDDDEEEDDLEKRLDRCLHEAREVQEMSMRMSEQQQYLGRNQYHHQQQQQQRR